MKSKLIALLGLVTVGATGLALTSFALPKGLEKQAANATPYSVTLEEDDFKGVTLEDVKIFEGKIDKHFTIELTQGHYIEGWVLFNYYEGQAIEGNTLGSTFHSTGDYFDYNVFFSVRGAISVSYSPYYRAGGKGQSGYSGIGLCNDSAFIESGYDFVSYARTKTYSQLRVGAENSVFGYGVTTNEEELGYAGGRPVSTKGSFSGQLINCCFSGSTNGGNEVQFSMLELTIQYEC